MPAIRRWLFLGLIVVGSQIAAGCCYNRPVLFPRLSPCVGGGCGPLFPRLAAPVASAPAVSGPVYDVPVYGGPSYGVAPAYGGVPCTSCGGHDAGFGVPIASTPPVMYGPGPGGSVAPPPNFSVPMTMPGQGSMAPTGIPFDSALVTPTVKPPTGGGVGGAPDSKKVMLTAGK